MWQKNILERTDSARSLALKTNISMDIVSLNNGINNMEPIEKSNFD